MGRAPAGYSGEEDMDKTVNLIRKSLQEIMALEGKGTGSEKLGTQLKGVSSGLRFIVLSLSLSVPFPQYK